MDTVRLKILRFENAIEEVVKRHHPHAWAAEIAKRLKGFPTPFDKPIAWLPHELLDSIEACCRYKRGQRDDPPTERRLRQAVNVYRSHEDPYTTHILNHEKDIGLFGQVMHRQQLLLQMSPTDIARIVGRYVWMLDSDEHLTKTNSALQDKYGFTTRQWLILCLGIMGAAESNEYSIVHNQNLKMFHTLGIGRDPMFEFLNASARTIEQIKKQYMTEKEDLLKAKQLRFSLRSPFLDHPLIRMDEGLIAPLPYLLVPHIGSGLFRVASAIPNEFIQSEFSDRLEQYTYMLFSEMYPSVTILREPDMKEQTTGKVVDFLLKFDDCVLLAECKATRFSTRFICLNAAGHMPEVSSTVRICEGMEQIRQTSRAIRDGDFDSVGISRDSPLCGIVITLGEIPFANSDWFWEHALIPNLNGNDVQDLRVGALVHQVQILSLTDLELFAVLAKQTGKSVLSLIAEKLARPYAEDGDWQTYIPIALQNRSYVVMPEVREKGNQFFNEVKDCLGGVLD